MFRSHQIKSNHRVLGKNEVEIYGTPVFATDYIAIVLAAIICTNSNVHYLYIRFQLIGHNPNAVALPFEGKVSNSPVALAHS